MESVSTAVRPSDSRLPTAEDAAFRRGGKYLLFQLRSEQFGVDVMQVREIIGLQRVTAVPHTPPYVRGVINLRGKVVPVVDLRVRLGLDSEDLHARTCIIVVETMRANTPLLVGVVVDAVSEVVSVPDAVVDPPPEFADSPPRPYILGMAKLGGRVCIMLAMDRVLATQESFDLAVVARSPAAGPRS